MVYIPAKIMWQSSQLKCQRENVKDYSSSAKRHSHVTEQPEGKHQLAQMANERIHTEFRYFLLQSHCGILA